MGSAYPLTGRSILVVEDEPLISLDMAVSLEGAGAQVFSLLALANLYLARGRLASA